MIFSIMLFAPQYSYAAPVPAAPDPTLEPPTPEDMPFEYPEGTKADDIDSMVSDAVALNMGLMLAGVVGGAMYMYKNQDCLRIPSVAGMAGASVIFLFKELFLMGQYQKLQSDKLEGIQTNLANKEAKDTQERTLEAALQNAKDGQWAIEVKRRWAIAYLVLVSLNTAAAIIETVLANGVLTSPFFAPWFTCTSSAGSVKPGLELQKIEQHFSKFFGLESAHAMGLSDLLLGLGLPAAGVAAILIGAYINNSYLKIPVTRAVFLGTMIALNSIVIALFDKVIAVYQKRIDKLEELKKSIQVGKATKIAQDHKPSGAGSAAEIKSIAPTQTSKDLVEDGGCVNSTPAPDPSCAGPALEMRPIDSKTGQALGPTLAAAFGAAGAANNAAAKGQGRSGNAALNSYYKNNKNALRDGMRKNLVDLNKSLANANKPLLDMTSAVGKMYNDQKATLLKAIVDTPGASLASLSTFSAPPSDAKSGDKNEKNGEAKVAAIAIPAFEMPTQAVPDGGGEHSAVHDGISKSAAAISADPFKGKALNMNDISKNSGVSIFTVLSVRYKISAYPKFFQKTEIKNPEAKTPDTPIKH